MNLIDGRLAFHHFSQTDFWGWIGDGGLTLEESPVGCQIDFVRVGEIHPPYVRRGQPFNQRLRVSGGNIDLEKSDIAADVKVVVSQQGLS
jgi:hypothetical protein